MLLDRASVRPEAVVIRWLRRLLRRAFKPGDSVVVHAGAGLASDAMFVGAFGVVLDHERDDGCHLVRITAMPAHGSRLEGCQNVAFHHAHLARVQA